MNNDYGDVSFYKIIMDYAAQSYPQKELFSVRASTVLKWCPVGVRGAQPRLLILNTCRSPILVLSPIECVFP